jgi:serine/threonine-protein kinase
MANEFNGETTSEPEISVAVLDGDRGDDGPLIGERFGKYLLVGELASGGMAQIFLAVHEGLEGFNRVVAVKRVLPNLTGSSEFVQMFLDEARIAARLEHPNIVRTYEFGTEAGRYFMVMEYLAGEDLNAVLNCAARSRQQLPIQFVVEVVSRVCAGLQFAHELGDSAGRPLGLVHRDVTPGNIVVTYFGEVKLIDFGVAKAATNAVHTRAGVLKGKVSYMSPEQLRGRRIDRRSDLFSVGVVFWELLTGVRLFARDSDAATLYAVIDDPIPSVRTHRADVPDAIVAIVERALARAPEDRWATAEDMQLELDSFLGGLHVSLGPGATPGAVDSGARGLARELEHLFGARRSNAKRGVAQNRSLAANVAVVATLQSGATPGPAGSFAQPLEAPTDSALDRPPVSVVEPPTVSVVEPPVRRRTRRWAIALIAVAMVAGAGGGLAYVAGHHDADAPGPVTPAPVALTVTSSPPGAAIYVAGEPTGMTTPATLSNIAPGRVAIRLELTGYPTSETVIELAPGASVTREIQLGAKREVGRLILANLPSGAVAIVDGDEHAAGEAIAVVAGRHVVRVVVHAQTIAQQTIETTSGDQVWELGDHELSPRRPR